MAEKTILVCDQCGRPAAETVTIRIARGNFVKDLCTTHVNELVSGARKPRRGRPRSTAAATTGKKRAGTATRKRSTAKRGAKRRGAKAKAA